MSDTSSEDRDKPGKLQLGTKAARPVIEKSHVKQSFSNRRTKTVEVEHKKRPPSAARTGDQAQMAEAHLSGRLSKAEMEARQRAIQGYSPEKLKQDREARSLSAGDLERARQEKSEQQAKPSTPAEAPPASEEISKTSPANKRTGKAAEPEAHKKVAPPAKKTLKLKGDVTRRQSKLTISQALEDEEGNKTSYRSLAAIKRARERERQRAREMLKSNQKVIREVIIPETITVSDLANRMAVQSAELIKVLMGMGVMSTANQAIDADTAELVVSDFGHKVKRVAEADIEDSLNEEKPDDANQKPRAPVITVMGHVDHGKTSLLDALRDGNKAAQEAGGITQHIGAHQIQTKRGSLITFLDTPGHEAFSAIRARGSKVTDIVILIVAADDGIQPQTIEAIQHAKAARVPVIVAINKCDKEGINPQQIKTDLSRHDIIVEDLGGDVQAVEISALKKLNLDKLEDVILLQADLLELRADPKGRARGVVIESKLERGLGPIATLIVQDGTLRKGDPVIAGSESGRVKLLRNEYGEEIAEAPPSMPVEIVGLQGLPLAGSQFSVPADSSRIREIANYRKRVQMDKKHTTTGKSTIENMFSQIGKEALKELPVILKTDTHGSLESITEALGKIGNEEVGIIVLGSGIGHIQETDVNLAAPAEGLVLGFNTRPTNDARTAARRLNVDISHYSIIYDLIDDMRQKLEAMLKPELKEIMLGQATIRQVFPAGKNDKAAGCVVSEGIIRKNTKLRLLRDNEPIHRGQLRQLKRFKNEVTEVGKGAECGISFENYNDVQEGDVIQCFEVKEESRKLP